MNWNKRYDGSRESLLSKVHTEKELAWIRNDHRRNPNISILYGKLHEEKKYADHQGSLSRVFVRLGYRQKPESTKKKSKHLGHYEMPAALEIKRQMDMKYVPGVCYTGGDDEGLFQYTMPDETSRERFIYACREQCSFSLLIS